MNPWGNRVVNKSEMFVTQIVELISQCYPAFLSIERVVVIDIEASKL